MKQNIDDLYKVRQFGKELGVPMVVILDVHPMSDGCIAPMSFRLTPEEAFDFVSEECVSRKNFLCVKEQGPGTASSLCRAPALSLCNWRLHFIGAMLHRLLPDSHRVWFHPHTWNHTALKQSHCRSSRLLPGQTPRSQQVHPD